MPEYNLFDGADASTPSHVVLIAFFCNKNGIIYPDLFSTMPFSCSNQERVELKKSCPDFIN